MDVWEMILYWVDKLFFAEIFERKRKGICLAFLVLVGCYILGHGIWFVFR